MDEDLILREIVKSLAFEIEAVNQDNVLKWSTTNGTPLNVKVRVRNKDEPRLVQRGTMPVPRIGISAPEKLDLVSSNQTILSFSVYLQEELERKDEQKRHSGFKLFNIGSCLGTYSDDEGPYLPSSSNQNAVGSNSSIISSSGVLKKKVSRVLSTSNTFPRSKKNFFGKCKPGGCLDPPFGEDNYSYDLAKTDCPGNLRLELHELEENKKTCEPGGCLDPHSSEEEYPYSSSKREHQENLGLKLDETADNSIERRKKPSEMSREYETFQQKTTKDEGEPKKLTDIYDRTSVENSLKLKYSNSIITYPTDKHSRERVSEQIPNRKISIKSNDDDSLRQSYEYPESYFVPPKDIIRYKEEQRRHVRKLSTDQLGRSSKVAAHDTSDKLNVFKTLSQESEDIPHNIKGSNAKLTDKINLAELQTNNIDITSEASVVERENAMLTQFSFKTENLQDDKDVVDFLVKQELPTTQRTSRETLNKLPPNKINMYETENLDDGIHIAHMRVNEHKLSARNTSRETLNTLFCKESNNNDSKNLQNDIDPVESLIKQEMSSTQRTSKELLNILSPENIDKDKTEYIEDSIRIAQMQVKEHNVSAREIQKLDYNNAQTQDQDVVKIERMQVLEKNANTGIQTSANVNEKFKNDGDKINDKFLQYKTNVAAGITPILATAATVVMTDKQSLQYKDAPNAMTDNQSMKEKNIDYLSYLEGHAQETDKQTFKKEPENVSPEMVSSTDNSDFDISSAHSTDFIQELSSMGKSNGLLETSSQKDKWVSPANNDIKEKNEFRDIKLSSETTEKKPSAILKKKPFITKHDSDVYNDDVNKATPLKRNTFTIIGSDTSLQKSEEIEVIPENITNAHFKSTDKTESFGKTRDNIDILDTLNKNTEDKILTSSATNITQKIKQDNLNVYSKIPQTTNPKSDNQARIKEESSDKSTKQSGNVFITDLDKSIRIPEKAYNAEPANYQTETLDTSSKAIKYKPMNANDTSHSNIAKDGESILDVQSPFKVEQLETKDTLEYTQNTDMSTLHQITGDIQSQITNNLEKYSSQKLLPDNAEHFDPKIKDENKLTDLYHQYEAEMSSQNPELYDTEYRRAKIPIDSELVRDTPTTNKTVLLEEYNGLGLESLQKPIPENNQEAHPTVYDPKAALSTREPDKLQIAGIDDKEYKTYNNGKPITETLQKPSIKIEKDLFSGISADERNLASIGHASDEMYLLDSKLQKIQNEMCDTSNIGSNQKSLSENTHDLQSVMTDDENQGRKEIKDEIYKGDKYEKSATDSIIKMQPENVQNLHAQVVDDIKDISFDQLYDKSKFLSTENNKPNETFMTEHVEDLHSGMQIHNELDDFKYSVLDKDDSLRMKAENEQYLHAQTADDNEHVASAQIYDNRTFHDTQNIDPKQKVIPEYVKDTHLMMADKSHDKTEITQKMYNEMDQLINSESNKDLLQIKSENVQNLPTHTVSDIEYVSSSQMNHKKTDLMNTENNIPPLQKVLPEQVRGLHSIIADKIIDKTELNGQIYNELDKVAYNELTADNSLNHAQTPEADKYISSDQNYDKVTILDPDSFEPRVKIHNSDIVDHDLYGRKYSEQSEVTQNLTDNIFGFKEKSKNASKNDSPFSGYSGLISEVLSNISENTEGEEKYTARIEVDEGISSRTEDFAIPDTKDYRDHEMLDNEFTNIVEEASFVKLSHDIDSNFKIDNDYYKVPQNSLAKSLTSTLEGSDESRQKETNAKAFESMQFIAHSSDKLGHRFDEHPTDALNIVSNDVLLDNTIYITNQNSEYQSSKILGSINDSILLNTDDFSLRQQEEQHLAKQRERKTIERQYQSHSSIYESKLDGSESTSLKKDPVYLDMSFYSYMNDNNERVVQTISPEIEQRSHEATVTVVKTLIRHGNEIRIPVDRENDISLNILDKDVIVTNKGRTIESSMRHTRREKHGDRAKRHEVLNKNLALIYEHELIPLHNVIKDLTEEVNTLSAQQEKLQMKVRNAKRTKSLRLIPVVKRCGCRRI